MFIWEQQGIANQDKQATAKPQNEGEKHFYRGKGDVRKAVTNKKSIRVNWEFEV